MSERIETRPWMTLVCAAALILTSVVAAAQDDGVPRRADGRPDLSGMYDIATLTPMVRPPQYGDRLALSLEEAEALAEHWRKNFEKDYQPSDPDREAPPEGGTEVYAPEFTGAAGKVGGYNAFFVDIGDGAFELDGKHRTSIITNPPDGRYPVMSEAGKRRTSRTSAFRHENTGTAWWIEEGLEVGPYDDPELRPLAERCLLARGASSPPIRPGMYNNLKRIVQTDDYVMMNVEWMHDMRIIPIGVPHDPDALPAWNGHSVGRWEGDELVVETTNFLESTSDSRTTKDLKVIERFSRIDGNDLRYKFTVHDPNYETTWSGEYPWPGTENRLYEYACHEGNYSFGGILKGARVLEADLESGATSDRD